MIILSGLLKKQISGIRDRRLLRGIADARGRRRDRCARQRVGRADFVRRVWSAEARVVDRAQRGAAEERRGGDGSRRYV